MDCDAAFDELLARGKTQKEKLASNVAQLGAQLHEVVDELVHLVNSETEKKFAQLEAHIKKKRHDTEISSRDLPNEETLVSLKEILEDVTRGFGRDRK
jgi:uncharacterized protein YijF (DUF1287 family)